MEDMNLDESGHGTGDGPLSEPPALPETAAPPPPAPQPGQGGGGGMAGVSLAFGVVGLATSFLVIGLIPSLIGLVLGMLVLARRGKRQEMAAVGAGLSGCGVLVAGGILIVGILTLAGLLFNPDKETRDAMAAIQALPDNTKAAPPTHTLAPLWTRAVAGAVSAASADWNGDGAPDLVVLAADGIVCLDAAGQEIARFPVEEKAPVLIRCGQKQGRPRAAVLSARRLGVYDAAGKREWEHSSLLEMADLRWVRAAETDEGDSLFVGMRMLKGVLLLTPDGAEAAAAGTPPLVYSVAAAPGKDGAPRLFVCSSPGVTLFTRRADEFGSLTLKSFLFSLAAATATADGSVQILALGGLPPANLPETWNPKDGMVVALDAAAKPLWRCPAKRQKGAARPDSLAAGDFDGDTHPDWVVPGVDGLLVLTGTGGLLCRTDIPQGVPLALPRPGLPDLLAVVADGQVSLFEMKPDGR